MSTTEPQIGAVRERILGAAWAMIEAGRLSELTMAAVAKDAGVSRQTVYVQFGTRAGLLVALVRERDLANPRGRQLARALETADPVAALAGLTRVLARWWRDIHPIAQALYAASLTDEGARAAWEDRMAHMQALTEPIVRRLDDAGLLAPGWDVPLARDWLAAQLNPIGWALLVEGTGWPQKRYEERLLVTVRKVLLAD